MKADQGTYICSSGGISELGNVVVASNKLGKIVNELIEYLWNIRVDRIKWERKHTFTPLGYFFVHIAVYQPKLESASTRRASLTSTLLLGLLVQLWTMKHRNGCGRDVT